MSRPSARNHRPRITQPPGGVPIVDPRPTIVICVPGEPDRHTRDACDMLRFDKGVRAALKCPGGDAAQAWNQAAEFAIAHRFDYLICIDPDAVPENMPYALLAFDKDVIGMPGPRMIWGGKRETAYAYQAFDQNGDDLVPVDGYSGLRPVFGIGSGLLVVRVGVLERVRQEFGGPFNPDYDDKGLVRMSPMLAFCKRARSLEVEVWTHSDYRCEVFQRVPLGLVIRDLLVASEGRGAEPQPDLKLAEPEAEPSEIVVS